MLYCNSIFNLTYMIAAIILAENFRLIYLSTNLPCIFLMLVLLFEIIELLTSSYHADKARLLPASSPASSLTYTLFCSPSRNRHQGRSTLDVRVTVCWCVTLLRVLWSVLDRDGEFRVTCLYSVSVSLYFVSLSFCILSFDQSPPNIATFLLVEWSHKRHMMCAHCISACVLANMSVICL